jgi:hypothetical protein
MLWRRKSRARFTALSLLAGGAVAFSTTCPALAQTATDYCDALNLPHPVYGAGGSAITADLALVATALSKLPEPITVFFADPSACTGFKYFLENNPTTDFKYWGTDGKVKTCKPPATGVTLAFAHMGNPASDCTGLTVPAEVKDFLGPVQTLNIITGPQSNEQSISAEALYFIFGKGAAGEASPWTNTAHIVKRTPTSFVHLFLAANIGVPAASFKGDVQVGTNQDSITQVKKFAGEAPNDALGYVSGSAADAAGGDIKTLAYQAKDQTCGYWPDSTAAARDKRNVRNGQYALWTPGHFFARTGGSGEIANEDAKNLISWYQGASKAPGDVDVVGLTIDSGDIPGCAMRVTREGLSGAISSYAPPAPCSHFFEKRATGATTGTACTTDDECKSVEDEPKCHFGYCEAY